MTDYVMSSADIQTLQTLMNQQNRQSSYAFVIERLETAKSNGYSVDEGTLAWAKAAKEINNEAENGIDGGFVPKYVEVFNRLGGLFSGHIITNADLSNASEGIANGFFNLIITGGTTGNPGYIPSVADTFENDIEKMVELLQLENEDWAGVITANFFYGFDTFPLFTDKNDNVFLDLPETLFKIVLAANVAAIDTDIDLIADGIDTAQEIIDQMSDWTAHFVDDRSVHAAFGTLQDILSSSPLPRASRPPWY